MFQTVFLKLAFKLLCVFLKLAVKIYTALFFGFATLIAFYQQLSRVKVTRMYISILNKQVNRLDS